MSEARKTSTGLQENVAGLLCYLGWWVTGIIFLVVEKENKFVRFHAWQSIFAFGAWFVVSLVLGFIIPFIAFIIWPLGVVLWIVLMLKAYQGGKVMLPVVGKLAEQYSNK